MGAKTKLLEQPIPASYLKLEERVRHLAVSYKERSLPPLLKEQDFMYAFYFLWCFDFTFLLRN